jgi:hypothetical protein
MPVASGVFLIERVSRGLERHARMQAGAYRQRDQHVQVDATSLPSGDSLWMTKYPAKE